MTFIAFSTRRRRAITLAVALSLALGAAYSIPAAQTAAKKPLTVDDYTKWRSITGPGDLR